ncbi:1-(5-phosphoribosyl)-5-[(5-phosphoribosylamino)methylideneamino]imidazole-4-carboxamide isomerase [Buchnera aphidicola]|uniref:1-(5-phosphoribosyl)-5-[(5- phosphoribosylamino)methylideneamino]imidazole-4- carboxamide isomerase n=1 Tax=Buchnera aphidicola TaxID=9 RepID=UPI0031B73B4C
MIIPALDIMNNKIVRLYQGNFSKVTIFPQNILDKIFKYIKMGAKYIHIIDLNGCQNPLKNQKYFIKKLIPYKNFFIQIGGGIRNFLEISQLLDLGVKRVILGTSVIEDPNFLKKILKKYGGKKIILALDVCINSKNISQVVINGWKKITYQSIEDILNFYKDNNLKYVLCTDITRDGTLQGPNLQLYTNLVQNFPQIYFQASGGIGNLSDIRKIKKTGVKDLIIGRALLEKKFTFLEAKKCWLNG